MVHQKIEEERGLRPGGACKTMKMTDMEALRRTAQQVLPLLQTMFGAEIPFVIQDTYRTNSETVSICVQLPGEAAVPLVDVQSLPEDAPVEELANTAAVLAQSKLQQIQSKYAGGKSVYTREKVLRHVVLQVLNRAENAHMMEACPHVDLLDLAGVFRVPLVPAEKGTLVTSLLRWQEARQLGLSVRELLAAARENTLRNFGVEAIRADRMNAQKRKYGMWYGRPLDRISMDAPACYTVTNQIRINGAALLLIPEVLQTLGEKLGGDYFVVPTSIHELMVRRDDGQPNLREMLSAALVEGNCSPLVTPPDAVLSDNLYRYSRQKGKLTIA